MKDNAKECLKLWRKAGLNKDVGALIPYLSDEGSKKLFRLFDKGLDEGNPLCSSSMAVRIVLSNWLRLGVYFKMSPNLFMRISLLVSHIWGESSALYDLNLARKYHMMLCEKVLMAHGYTQGVFHIRSTEHEEAE